MGFYLEFRPRRKTHRVTRTVGEDAILFDGVKLEKLTLYKETLDTLGVFQLPSERHGLSFRALISFFLRPTRGSYNSPDAAVAQWTPYQRILYQSFLLGLDHNLAIQKHDDKKRLDEQLELAARYKKDKELREFYIGQKNAEVELASLKEKITELERNLASFTVAKDYADRQAAADVLHARIQEAMNEEVILANRLSDIELAMRVGPDVAPDRVVKLYEEAKFALPDTVTKRLGQVEKFHERLHENRVQRLEVEKKQTLAEQKKWQSHRESLQKDLDALLQYLKAHGALDEYVENNRYLSELTALARKIEDYLALITKYVNEAQRIRAEMGRATVQTTEYLEKVKPHLELLMESFRGLAREFYGDKPAGLVVRNNDNDNQIRYDIESRIEHDAADGINQVRIFCFDLLLLKLQQRHEMEFLFHDSRLYAEMDPHQRLTLFRIADRVCRELGYQYIATINEDQIDASP